MWKEILKEESEYLEGQFLEEAKEDYQSFLESYELAKTMIPNMQKKYTQIVELLGDTPTGRLKDDILETIQENETNNGANYFDVSSELMRVYESFNNGNHSSTRLAGEVFEKMDNMMDLIWFWTRDL